MDQAYRWLSIAHMRMGSAKLRQVSLGLPPAIEVGILPRSNLGVEYPSVTAEHLGIQGIVTELFTPASGVGAPGFGEKTGL